MFCDTFLVRVSAILEGRAERGATVPPYKTSNLFYNTITTTYNNNRLKDNKKMKLAIFSLAATISAEKKVPNRTPLQRLNTLRRFAAEWTDANMDSTKGDKYENVLVKHANRMETKFNRCGFFDPNIKHGGPRPAGKILFFSSILGFSRFTDFRSD